MVKHYTNSDMERMPGRGSNRSKSYIIIIDRI